MDLIQKVYRFLFWRPTHQHYKGDYVKLLHCDAKSVNGTDMVVYESKEGVISVITVNKFNEYIPTAGKFRYNRIT